MNFSFSSQLFTSLYVSIIILISSSCFCLTQHTQIKGIDIFGPVVDITPAQVSGYISSPRGSKEAVICGRVGVSGLPRYKLGSYASAYRVALAPSVAIPEKYHTKIKICFHNNASLGLCACENDDWKSINKGIWFSLMSPYEEMYVDVKFLGDLSGSVTVSVEEELHRWRLFSLALGFFLLLLAPVVSSWVPFYYSSSMAIGILLVVIILLFQGMKLLPTGRKNIFYLTIYGSVLGAGSFIVHQVSVFVNSILASFGVSEDMHNPVSVFILVFIVLAGAGLGYWLVRKYVISEEGGVDDGVAVFVKWAMRIVAITLIFQSTVDHLLAVAAVSLCAAVCYMISSFIWREEEYPSYSKSQKIWARFNGETTAKKSRAEFLSRSPAKVSPRESRGTFWNGYGRKNSPAFSDSPLKGSSTPSTTSSQRQKNQELHYSTFHKTPNRKKFSKKEWVEFTDESTRQAVAEWASSPEFADWVINNADRIKVMDEADESVDSTDSTDENYLDSKLSRLFNW